LPYHNNNVECALTDPGEGGRDGERLDDAGGEAEHVDVPVVIVGISEYDTRRLIQNQYDVCRPRTGRAETCIERMRRSVERLIQGGPKKRGHSTFSQISRKLLKISK